MDTATARSTRPLRGKERIGVRVGKVLGRFKVAKHFKLQITDRTFACYRNQPAIDAEAALDGST